MYTHLWLLSRSEDYVEQLWKVHIKEMNINKQMNMKTWDQETSYKYYCQ